jgi:hypothetical protein
VFLARHSQTLDESYFDGLMCSSLKYISNRLSRAPKTKVVCKIYDPEKLRYQLIHRGPHDFWRFTS